MHNEPTVLRLTDRVEDVRYDSVIDALEYVLAACRPDGLYAREQDFVPTKCVIVMLDDRNRQYRIKSRPSSITMSEEVALLEIAKSRIIESMFEG
jgi:hypothetical protein